MLASGGAPFLLGRDVSLHPATSLAGTSLLPPTSRKLSGHCWVRHGRSGCHCSGNGEQKDWETVSIPDSLPHAGIDTDWREFRARLVASTRERGSEELEESSSRTGSPALESGKWAHALPGPEAGCLLIAHPLMFSKQQTYFSQAVIFIFVHSDTGSAGLILNRPTQYQLGKIAGAEDMCPQFAESTLYLGGDVGKSTLNILHSHGELEGAVEIVNGVYIGGFEAAKEAVVNGTAKAEDFRWFTRHAGWGPGQLENECASGVWFTAAAGGDLLLQHRDDSNPAEMWHEVLQHMGNDYSLLSDAVRQPYRPDIVGDVEDGGESQSK